MLSDTFVWITIILGIYLLILILFINYIPKKYRFQIIFFSGFLLLISMLYSLWLLNNNDNNTDENLKIINAYLNILSPQFNFEDSDGNKITYPGITF